MCASRLNMLVSRGDLFHLRAAFFVSLDLFEKATLSIMTIKDGAFPDTVSSGVKKLMEEFYHLSNAASTHTQHEKSKCEIRFLKANLFIDNMKMRRNSLHSLRKMASMSLPEKRMPEQRASSPSASNSSRTVPIEIILSSRYILLARTTMS